MQSSRMKERGKEKKRGVDVGWAWNLWVGGAESEEWFPLMGKPSHWQGNELRQKKSFRAIRKVYQLACGRQYRVRPTQIVHAQLCIPSTWDVWSWVHMGAWCWNVGLESRPRKRTAIGCEVTAWGWECRSLHLRILGEEVWFSTEEKCLYWVTYKGQGHHCRFSFNHRPVSPRAPDRAHDGVACKPLVSISSAPYAWVAHLPQLPPWLPPLWWGYTY